jgi:hypothetical protein
MGYHSPRLEAEGNSHSPHRGKRNIGSATGDWWSALEPSPWESGAVIDSIAEPRRWLVLLPAGVCMLLVGRLTPDCGGLPLAHWITGFGDIAGDISGLPWQ